MDQRRWQIIEKILDKALSLDNQRDREIFASRKCGNDDELYKEVICLLKSIEKADKANFLQKD